MHLKACCPDSTRLDNDIAPPTPVKSYHNHQENNNNQQSNKQQIQDN